ncbi:hypothetical protein CSOJ01_00411 [Colletotrichum sojae]|uniref:Uncharacterized protein n=1 Tax=Colletotrichum sojae TaxID=2175907 RepID=A0A8H6JYF4_9PEZI|nr:hypothetical protein CSOJ01_00411 [Colletotrichum sojae]
MVSHLHSEDLLELYIPPCLFNPAHHLHPPAPDRPLRICIEGPLVSVQRLLPSIEWKVSFRLKVFPQPAGPELAAITSRYLYGHDVKGSDMVVRHEYLGWVGQEDLASCIDYYGVTFDHNVPAGEENPEVLMINITDIEVDDGAYANQMLTFRVDPVDYAGKKIFALPRCCQTRKGTQDRWRVNGEVAVRDKLLAGEELTGEEQNEILLRFKELVKKERMGS